MAKRTNKIFFFLLVLFTFCDISHARDHQDGDCKVWNRLSNSEDWAQCDQYLEWATPASISTSTTISSDVFLAIGGTASNATYGNVDSAVPRTGQYSQLYCAIDTTCSAASQFDTTLYVNNAASALTCTIATGSLACSDTTHVVDVTAGQTVAIFFDETGTCSTTAASCYLVYRVDNRSN